MFIKTMIPELFSRHCSLKAFVMIGCMGLLTACNSTLNSDKLQTEIEEQFTKKTKLEVKDITCPSNIKIKKGDTFDCEIETEDGKTIKVDVTQKDDKGNIKWSTEEPNSSLSSPKPRDKPSSEPSSISDRNFQEVTIDELKTYEHTGSTITIDVPENWEFSDKSKPGELILLWSDPTGNGQLVTDIFDVDYDPTSEQLTELLKKFLSDTFGDEPDFYLDDPKPQKDGSVLLVWGYTGTATGNIKVKLLGNSFIENKDRRVLVLSFIVPDEQFKDLEPDLNKIINSYKIDPQANLP
jgi:serine/threonine-protein kinase